MSLFIANTTKQNVEIAYRLPEATRHFVETIRAGSQAEIYKVGSREDHLIIIGQLKAYGLRMSDEIKGNKDYIGLVAKFDVPFTRDAMDNVMVGNDDALNAGALELRKAAAAAMDLNLKKFGQEAGVGVGNLAVEIVEDSKPGKEVKIKERISVD